MFDLKKELRKIYLDFVIPKDTRPEKTRPAPKGYTRRNIYKKVTIQSKSKSKRKGRRAK